jgi:hypothetical protein
VHLDGLELIDFDDDSNDNAIDILIGADHYWDIVTGDVVKGESGPTVVSSKLGWLLSGLVPKSVESQDSTAPNLILTGESCDTLLTLCRRLKTRLAIRLYINFSCFRSARDI